MQGGDHGDTTVAVFDKAHIRGAERRGESADLSARARENLGAASELLGDGISARNGLLQRSYGDRA